MQSTQRLRSRSMNRETGSFVQPSPPICHASCLVAELVADTSQASRRRGDTGNVDTEYSTVLKASVGETQ